LTKLEELLKVHKEENSKFEYRLRMAYEEDDAEMISLMLLIKEKSKDILKMIEAIKTASKGTAKTAEFILSTVHKAKGLEWDNVLLCSDLQHYIGKSFAAYNTAVKSYTNPADQNKIQSKYEDYIEEINIYYVAATRAQLHLMDENQLNLDKAEKTKRNNSDAIEYSLEYLLKNIEPPSKKIHL
jgi:superfamily I DNA/RNA helicase